MRALYRNMHLSKYIYKRNKFYYIINKINNRSRFKIIFLPEIVWFWIQANRRKFLAFDVSYTVDHLNFLLSTN